MKEKIDIKKIVTKEITSDYFFVEGQNLTMLKLNENVVDYVKKEKVKNVMLILVNEVLANEVLFEKQKIVASINLLKDLRTKIQNEKDIYSINLVIKNLKAYHKTQKENGDKNISKQDRDFIINSLIMLPFNLFFNETLKAIYTK